MDRVKLLVFSALFYPVVIVLTTAGLLAFVLLLMRVDLPMVAAVVLWFTTVGFTGVFLISQKVLKSLGYFRFFFLSTLFLWLLSLLYSLLLFFTLPTS